MVASHVSALATVVYNQTEQPFNSLLVSGGVDGTVRLWNLPSGEPLDEFNVGQVRITVAVRYASADD